MSDFGEILRGLRKNANMTQQELADALWISKSTVSCYEQNTRCPSPEMLVKIANTFHVSTDYLLGIEQKRQMIDVTGLNDEDVDLVCAVITHIRRKNRDGDKMPLA